MFKALANAKADEALKIIDDMLMHGYDLAEFVSMFSIFLRDLYMVKAHGSPDILNTTENLKKDYSDLAKEQDAHALIRMLSIVNDEMQRISRSSNIKILVETLFIKLANLQDLRELDEMIGQLKNASPTPPPQVTKPSPKPAPVTKKVPVTNEPSSNSYSSPILNGNLKGASSVPKKVEAPIENNKEPSEKQVSESAANDEVHAVTLDEVKDKWQAVIDCIQPQKPAVASLLCNVGILDVKNDTLILAVEDDYSINTITRSELIISNCLETVLGKKLLLRLEKNKVANNQRVVEKKEIDEATKQIIQSFEGELL